MKKKNLGWTIAIIGGLLLLIILPLISGDSAYTEISYEEFKQNFESDDFSFVYIGNDDCDDCNDMKPILNQIKDKHLVGAKYLNTEKLSKEELEEIRGLDDKLKDQELPLFLFIRYGEVIDILAGKTNGYEEFEIIFLRNYNEKNLYAEVNAKQFIDLFNGKEKVFLVIGQTQCPHCINYKKVINKVLFNYKADIYYLEFDLLTTIDKQAIIDLDASLQGLATPYTMITENGKILDSIDGATTYPLLLEKLQEHNFIKEKTNE